MTSPRSASSRTPLVTTRGEDHPSDMIAAETARPVLRRIPRRPLHVFALLIGLAAVLGASALALRPAPAAAAQASQVIVRAHGNNGLEEMALLINGTEVSRWTVTTEPADYVFNAESPIEVETAEVVFVRDDGVRQDLHVDYIDVGGIVLQSESRATISTGTFVGGDGCVERPSVSETLHCRGSFSYAVPQSTNVVGSPPPEADAVTVRALGRLGTERMEIVINDEVQLSQIVGQDWETYSVSLPAGTTITDAEVRFNNSVGASDLRVDFLAVDGERYESEDRHTRAVGTWVGNRCLAGGESNSEWLHCRGSFRYDVNNTAAVSAPSGPVDEDPDESVSSPAAPIESNPPSAPSTDTGDNQESAPTTDAPETSEPPTTEEPPREVVTPAPTPSTGTSGGGRYSIAQVIDGTIGAGDGSNPNEESPMGRHDAPLALNQGWNWAQGPTRNSVWGQLGSGNSRFAEFRCAVIPELGHTPSVPFRINVREGAYYQFVNNDWRKAFDVDLTGGNHGAYLGTAGGSNSNPFNSGSHGLIEWRREADGSYSAPWNPNALMMHFWAAQRQAPANGQTAEFLTSEVRLQQPDGQTVDLSRVNVLFQCGIDYYSTTGGQGTQVPGPGIAKYHRATESWQPGLWVTLPRNTPANSVSDFASWLEANTPPNVG